MCGIKILPQDFALKMQGGGGEFAGHYGTCIGQGLSMRPPPRACVVCGQSGLAFIFAKFRALQLAAGSMHEPDNSIRLMYSHFSGMEW